MRPLILTTTSTDEANYRTPYVVLGAPYVRAVEQPEATAVLVTPAHSEPALEQLQQVAHGLVLTGGEDIAPRRYGEEPHPKLGAVNEPRDAMELALLHRALERDMPVLAICRGMQLLNVALGGTLYQDLPSQLGGDLLHEQSAPVNHRWHPARVEEGSRLAEIFGHTELHINSFHHQGIRTLGTGLEARAWASDGLVEAVEGASWSWVTGVQWHPERGEAEALRDRRQPDRRLFWAFAQACREYAARERLSLR